MDIMYRDGEIGRIVFALVTFTLVVFIVTIVWNYGDTLRMESDLRDWKTSTIDEINNTLDIVKKTDSDEATVEESESDEKET
jgi:hypothetical protein